MGGLPSDRGRSCLALVDESLHDLGRARLTEDSPEVVLVGDLGGLYLRAPRRRISVPHGRGRARGVAEEPLLAERGRTLRMPGHSSLRSSMRARKGPSSSAKESFFRIALEDMGLEASAVAMVGDDAEADVAGAKKAGLSGIQVRTGKWRPGGDVGEADLVLDSVAALPMALEGER